jgi:polysaccharide export outer membrane protein
MKNILHIFGKFLVLFLIVSAVFFSARSYAELDEAQINSLLQKYEAPAQATEDHAPVVLETFEVAPAPAPTQASEVERMASPTNSYSVGPDEELRITVYEEPELSSTYKVSGDGLISMPLIGDIQVNGLTLSEIDDKITAALSEGYLINPSVSIEVSKYRPFYILGEVRTPGSYSFVTDMSVLNAAALAGGFTYRANRKSVELLRTRNSEAQIIKEHPVAEAVLPGDIILVKERFF